MDLNEVPCDFMANGVKIEEKTIANFDDVNDKKLGYSRIKSNEVEQRGKEVEEKSLVLELEIRNKEIKLEDMVAKIRVLGDEKVRIEEAIRGLKKKKKGEEGAVDGGEAGETKGGECEIKGDEVPRIDQLIIENKRLECERNVAVKEVAVWEQKCKQLESQMIELEGRFKCKNKDSKSIGIKANGAAPMNCGVVCGSRHLVSPYCGPDAMGGVVLVEGTADKQCLDTKDTPITGMHVKRRLAYRNKRRCVEKIAPPPTPAGGKSSAASIIDLIDCDKECDVHDRHKPSQSEEGADMMLEHIDENMDDDLDEEKQSGGSRGESPSILTPITKRKRDLMVITSDDECENIGCTPTKRALKIENSDNEGEEDDEKNKIIGQVSNKIASESDDDNDDGDDDKPISQLIRRRAHQCLSQTAGSKPTRPRRRLVKYGQAEQKNKPEEVENHPDTLTTENAANYESSEEESESSVRSLSNFIVDDSDDEDVEDDALKEDSEEDDALKEDSEEDDALKEVSKDHSVELEDDDSDSNLNYDDIISSFRSRRDPNSKWISEGDMLSDFGKNPELCMRAVCALYRQQTNEEQASKASFVNNGRGFSKFDATRGSRLGDFLTDGDPTGDLVKSVEELQEFHYDGLEECRALADRYSKQLFNIYINKEDHFFS